MRIINDSNWQDVLRPPNTDDGRPEVMPRITRCGSPEAIRMGLMPISERPDLLIPESEWKERIAEANAERTMPYHHWQDAGCVKKSQNGYGYCWAYGLTSAVEMGRLGEAQPYTRLAPNSLGWLVNWRNAGYYCDRAIAGAKERGIASLEKAGGSDGVFNHSKFASDWEEDAKNYRPSEWFDTGGSQAEMARQCVSILLIGLPIYIAYNWWGHALMAGGIEYDESCLYNIRWLILNSHGDGWIKLEGNRGVPDEGYGIGSTTYYPHPDC